ncbi:DUF4159 domain-containing protein [uncultured Parvibaculum sp.]|uniref:DUF4159 domain-containing protein n=1 Tax=uncultured Parvibaculum sp. TaxID=291828 RepID=UPI0030DC4827
MLTLGPLAFAAPWVLTGLIALPAIWWLLRIAPPSPKRIRFPAIRLLQGLSNEEETPAHTPLWLLILRMLLAAIVIIALAEPLWNPAPKVSGGGPLLIVIDDGWASAADWNDRQNARDSLIAAARREDRPVLTVGTAPRLTPGDIDFSSPDDAASRARAMEPRPFAPDRMALAERLEKAPALKKAAPHIVWIGDGLDYGKAADFSEALARIAGKDGVTLIEPAQRALALLPPESDGDALVSKIRRASPADPGEGTVQAIGTKGNVLATASFAFEDGALETNARLQLPLELRNRIDRLQIVNENSAGAVTLLDERWRRRAVGLVSGSGTNKAQALLSDLYYIRKALAPYAELREAGTGSGSSSVAELLSRPLSALMLADVGTLTKADEKRVADWVEKGGTLVRFAGPHLAAQSDSLIPVPLRHGGRALGGALSWTEPQHLAPFDENSPFAGLTVPKDVNVSRQVLAEPTLDLGDKTWARLTDGTPLVTAAKRGKGRIVLFHVTANTDWSNLPISGLFVDMLRRLVAKAQNVAEPASGKSGDETLSPVATLNGFGRLGTPSPTVTAIPARELGRTDNNPRHPPGLYGPQDAPRARNLASDALKLTPATDLPGLSERRGFAAGAEIGLRPPLLGLALLLLIADGIAALWVTGLFETGEIRRGRLGRNLLPLLLLGLVLAAAPKAFAADNDNFDIAASTETRLAYVITGDTQVDEVSREGLNGLSNALRQRTAFEPDDPMGVDVAKDELAFFPLLYWPMTANQPPLSPETLGKIDAYMKNGGMILFDTRDQQEALSGAGGNGPGARTLQRLLAGLDLPALEPVPANHVLTRSFYLLKDFPGRWAGGQLWVAASDSGSTDTTSLTARTNDGVSPIIIGSNDYAAAWAVDNNGRARYPVVPGGERQREMAERVGINLVMYALTGNYKSDQVHIPALLERLGQ